MGVATPTRSPQSHFNQSSTQLTTSNMLSEESVNDYSTCFYENVH